VQVPHVEVTNLRTLDRDESTYVPGRDVPGEPGTDRYHEGVDSLPTVNAFGYPLVELSVYIKGAACCGLVRSVDTHAVLLIGAVIGPTVIRVWGIVRM